MKAYRDLCDFFYHRLNRTAYAFIKSKEPAEEIVSDVFIKVWQMRAKLLEIDNLSVYLYTVTKNLCLKYITRQYKNPVTSLDIMHFEIKMQDLKPKLMPYVLESFERMKREADIVLVEGAGSASEINLRKNDIANMGFARAADVPVVVIGDIDRGGVIASLVGTKAVLDAEDAKLVAGFIVNRMRGDISLFADGMEEIARRTGWPALGLVPFFEGARRLPAEDAYDLIGQRHSSGNGKVRWRCRSCRISPISTISIHSPRSQTSNWSWSSAATPLPVCDLIVVPGSKSTIADFKTLREVGWDIDIAAHVRRGGHVLGLCGGYQMLGVSIADPHGIEGPGRIGARLEPVAGRHGHRRREGARRSQRHDNRGCRARQRL